MTSTANVEARARILPAGQSGRPNDLGEPVGAAVGLLRRHGLSADADAPEALATAVMDLYRRTGSAEAFEVLVRLSRDRLRRRVQARTRYLGDRVDADELLQDAFINIYRYPDRFNASRPGAFKAWSSTIVDNAVRRHLRRSGGHREVSLRPVEILAQEPDRQHKGPGDQAIEAEAFERAASAYQVLLCLYLHAFQQLSERERFVLQMVEVKRLRYAELAGVLDLRPEALKMVVFRARKRIFERVSNHLATVQPRRPVRAPRRSRVEVRLRPQRFAAVPCAV